MTSAEVVIICPDKFIIDIPGALWIVKVKFKGPLQNSDASFQAVKQGLGMPQEVPHLLLNAKINTFN